jgi:hypothetical protein
MESLLNAPSDKWKIPCEEIALISPWENNIDIKKTLFKCFATSDYFNFYFDVEDADIVNHKYQNKFSVEQNERVELYFSASLDLNNYYCIEIDSVGNILDYNAHYYRKMDYKWSIENIRIAASKTVEGYTVEGKIPLHIFDKLGIDMHKSFFMGVFRADFNRNGDEIIWYSWKDPLSSKPDFHIKTAFGECLLTSVQYKEFNKIRQ